jgi:hypothetical protein
MAESNSDRELRASVYYSSGLTDCVVAFKQTLCRSEIIGQCNNGR